MHLRQPGFKHSVCGLFTKNKERIQKFKETCNSRSIYQNERDKACFQHDMGYEDFKDLIRRTTSDKIVHDKDLNISKTPKFDGYQHGLASMDYKFFDKSFLLVVLKMRIFQTRNHLKNYKNQLLKSSRKISTLSCYKQYLGC